MEFDPAALNDLKYWVKTDRKIALKILELIDDIQRHPFIGLGKPEPLKHHLSGCWSRRIDQKNRMVYQVEDDKIIILQCKYHYDQ